MVPFEWVRIDLGNDEVSDQEPEELEYQRAMAKQ